MNETIKETMRQELAKSKGGFGIVVGFACYFILFIAVYRLPGFDVLMKDHDWPGWAVLIVSVSVGWISGTLRMRSIWNELNKFDEDTLRYHHDKLSRKKLKSDVIGYIVLALIVAYFIFKK